MSTAPEPLIRVRGLCTWFPIRRGVFTRTVGHVKAVDQVDLDVQPGETLGLVGESGCGKTTLGRSLLGLERSTRGQIRYRGQDLTQLSGKAFRQVRRNLQMIFQDPYSSLNPRMTVMDIVTEGLAAHGLLRESRPETATRLLAEVGLGANALYRYPHEFSGGQRQRISVARALSLKPEFIVCDEAVSALDVSVQAQVINLLIDLRERHGLSYLFITHDLGVVRHLSQRVAVMYLGRIVELGPTHEVIDSPLHPYSQALVSAIPTPGVEKKQRIVLHGDIPSPADIPPGCPFHTRCPKVMAQCRSLVPQDHEVQGRRVRCHLFAQ